MDGSSEPVVDARCHPASMLQRPRARSAVVSMSTVFVVTTSWSLYLLLSPDPQTGQLVSNIGLTCIAFAAGIAAVVRASRTDSLRRFWRLIGLAALSWSLGQAVWTTYESVLGIEVPFPSFADVGYLGMPPLAAAALLGLPLAATTLAGRARTILDGLMVAASMLLVTWILVLGPLVRAGGESAISQAISFAYPVGDTVLITLVLYTWLRARQSHTRLSLSLPMVGTGLLCFAVADSGFVYLTTAGTYNSGDWIDLGWFSGFALILMAALTPERKTNEAADEDGLGTQLGTFLPYTAVTVALMTSAIEIYRSGQADIFVSWTRTALMGFLVARQILTLRENWALTRTLEQRVEARTAELESSQAAVRGAGAAQLRRGHRDRPRGGYHLPEPVLSARSRARRRVDARPAGVGFMDDEQAALLREGIDSAAEESLRMQTVHNVWRRADGSECHLEVTITNLLFNEDVQGLVLNSRDVTDRTILEEQLLHQAFHDSLTALSNRAMFKNRLEHALTRRDLAAGSLAVLFLDLDGFKEVNDTLGHSTGDQLAGPGAAAAAHAGAAQRHCGPLRRRRVRRPGRGSHGSAPYSHRGSRSGSTPSSREPYQLAGDGGARAAQASGSRTVGQHARDAEQLLRNADLAMYQAKGAAAGGYALYDPRMHAGLVERVRLEADLRTAIEREELRRLLPAADRPCGPAGSPGWRLWCAGSTRTGAWCRPTSSSRSPSPPA